MTCRPCGGMGYVIGIYPRQGMVYRDTGIIVCPKCKGNGRKPPTRGRRRRT
jgi:hypothetical protein